MTTEYALYLESGPRRRKTMVHVLDLLGCIAQGPTTETALEATPEAIRAYLRFLRQHGEAVEPESSFTTRIAEHVTEGAWLGNGDPTPGFGPDFQPMGAEELSAYLRRLAWLRADLLQPDPRCAARAQLLAEPEGSGRSIYRILEHVAAAECVYLRMIVGKVDGLPAALGVVQQGAEALPTALTHLWQIISSRLEVMTETGARAVGPARPGDLDGSQRTAPYAGARVGTSVGGEQTHGSPTASSRRDRHCRRQRSA